MMALKFYEPGQLSFAWPGVRVRFTSSVDDWRKKARNGHPYWL